MRRTITFDVISKFRQELMGLSILMVVFFHFVQDCRSAKVHYSTFFDKYFIHIGSSNVDVFLFLSGIGLYYSLKKRNDIKQFFKKRLDKILLPYFLVAIPTWYVVDCVLAKKSSFFFKDLFFITFFTKGTTLFWYVFMILLCYLIFPKVFEYIDSSKDDVDSISKILSLVSFVMVLCLVINTYQPDLFKKINIFLLRFPAFFGGAVMGRLSYNKAKVGYGTYLLIVTSFLINRSIAQSNIHLLRYVIGFSAICGSILLAILADVILNKLFVFRAVLFPVLRWIGKYTFELYIGHVAIRRILNTKGLRTYRYRNELIVIVGTIVVVVVVRLLCWLYSYVKKRLMAKNNARVSTIE